jgi:hypothetical protein
LREKRLSRLALRPIVAVERLVYDEIKISFARPESAGFFLFGLAQNARLLPSIARQQERAQLQCEITGKAARVFTEFKYATLKSWECARRVIAKAEHLPGKANPRFVVTALPEWEVTWDEQVIHNDARTVYEKLYCARGEMENRLKEQQLDLFADRTSTHWLKANQVRLWLSAAAARGGERSAADGLGGDGTGAGVLRDDPPGVVQDRRGGAGECPAPHGGVVERVSAGGVVWARPATLASRADLTVGPAVRKPSCLAVSEPERGTGVFCLRTAAEKNGPRDGARLSSLGCFKQNGSSRTENHLPDRPLASPLRNSG